MLEQSRGKINLLVNSIAVVHTLSMLSSKEVHIGQYKFQIVGAKHCKEVCSSSLLDSKMFGVNLVTNNSLNNGLESRYGMGNCSFEDSF